MQLCLYSNLTYMCACRTHLDLGGCVIRGLSVKVTDEVTGKFCISSGFKHGFTLPIPHSILHVVSMKLKIEKRVNAKQNVLKVSQVSICIQTSWTWMKSYYVCYQEAVLYLISTAWMNVWGTPCTLPMMPLHMWMRRWVGTAEHSPVLFSAGWLEFCTEAEI